MASAEAEYNNNKQLKKSDVEALEQWLHTQPHLPKISDRELIFFLHSNYYHLEPTKTTIDAYYTVRTHMPEFFSNRDPIGTKALRDIMQVVSCSILPGTTKEGYKIIFGKVIDSDPSRYVFTETMKFLTMTIDVALRTQGTSPGYIILFDMKGVLFGHVARLSPVTLKRFCYYLQEALPIRLKGLHFMNTVSFIDVILAIMKPFMKKELWDIFVMHTDLESLSKYIPLEILPNDQGGKAEPLMDLHDATIKQIEEYRAWFLEEEVQARVDESVRPEKAKNATDLFSVQGSFKHLNID